MNIFSERTKAFLIKFKWVILPIAPIFFFILVLLFTYTVIPATQNPTSTQPTGTAGKKPYVAAENLKTTVQENSDADLERRKGLQKTEALPDGSTQYTYTSQNPDRPNILIVKGTVILFQRTVTLPAYPVKIVSYTNSYGNAKWIFKGSVFYGPDTQTYIYPELGFAFIANPKTGNVLEQHAFTPMKVEEYVKKYGDDIPTQP